MRRSSPRVRRGRAVTGLLLVLLLASLPGCSFLASEFGWFERRPPSMQSAPDAPPSGVQERP